MSFRDLCSASDNAAAVLLGAGVNRQADPEDRVCFLAPPGFDYVVTKWGIWGAGAIAVPMAVSHPEPELAYVLDDAKPAVVVAHPSMHDRLEQICLDRGLPLLTTDAFGGPARTAITLFEPVPDARAMMVYTSGTTGQPKGVVTRHRHVRAQIESLVEAWGWTAEDRLLLTLPLHHIHGAVVALASALWSGASTEILPRFDATTVWEHLASGKITVFMAVPTIYKRLIRAWDSADDDTRVRWRAGASSIRLMTSGSAALPIATLERWKEISGHTLLERYGMTEIGIALSNHLVAENRRPGFVGAPLANIEVRLVDGDNKVMVGDESGQIQVRGPQVFDEYWMREDETAAAFADGWFETGDEAMRQGEEFRILGRQSVDIIKTGGYKVSALEIENILRGYPGVVDAAVIGLDDEDWGEAVCAVLETSEALQVDQVKAWSKERIAAYKVPRAIVLLDQLPRNAMGKTLKTELKELFR